MNLLLRVAALGLVVLAAFALLRPERTPGDPAKLVTYRQAGVTLIPGQYLVLFDERRVSAARAPALARKLAGSRRNVTHVFTAGVRGFAAKRRSGAWARRLSARADVRLVSEDFVVHGTELRGSAHDPVPWNLDRVDQRTQHALDRDYRLKTGNAGPAKPVPVYVLDNGVFRDHSEFAGPNGPRVVNVADVTGRNFARCPGADADHGTGVASLVAGTRLGITQTLIKNVKVLDTGLFGCLSGSMTNVVAGLDRTLEDMTTNQHTRAVVNLSLGWEKPHSIPVQAAIKRLQDAGALVVAAAGNDNHDAQDTEPANRPGVLAVGATTNSDARAISNYGATVDLWAPGWNVKAADWPAGASPNANATRSTNGTSIAAPHVSGAAALLWRQHPTLTADQVSDALIARSTRHMLTGLGNGSINRLLYVGEDAPAPGPQWTITPHGGALNAVAASRDGTRVFVAGRDVAGTSSPLAAFDAANIGAGPKWSSALPGLPADAECVDIRAGELLTPPWIGGHVTSAGCMGTRGGAREAFVVATQEDGKAVWPQPVFLGPGTTVRGVTGEFAGSSLRVYAIGTRPVAGAPNQTEVFVAALDAETGQVLAKAPLTAAGFNEPDHQAVDLALLEVNNGGSYSAELVAATYSDPPGADKTFLWKLDPSTLQVTAFKRLPDPPLATNGMFATALTVQPLEENGSGIEIPAQVFLATQVSVATPGGAGTEPWAYLYRLNADRVTAQTVDVVKNAHITSLSSQDGDLYFGGMTTRTFPAGDVLGTLKPGLAPDYDSFIGKSEGAISSRRWMRTFGTAGHDGGHGAYSREKAYIASENATTLTLTQYPVH